MASLATKIKAYAENNGVSDLDFTEQVQLQDDMVDGKSNPYIKEWNVEGLAKPEEADLSAVESQADDMEYNASQIAKRVAEYKAEDQIENIIEKGLDAEKARVDAIKSKYPKK